MKPILLSDKVRRLLLILQSLIILILITLLFYKAEQPELHTTNDVVLYLSLRLLLATIVYVGSIWVKEQDYAQIYRRMVTEMLHKEKESRIELPHRFEVLAGYSILIFDMTWFKDVLFKSPLMYTRLISIDRELSELRKDYYKFNRVYTGKLLKALIMRYPESYKQYVKDYEIAIHELFTEIGNICYKTRYRSLYKRRNMIIKACMSYHDKILKLLNNIGKGK
jgi:hypothetical protein